MDGKKILREQIDYFKKNGRELPASDRVLRLARILGIPTDFSSSSLARPFSAYCRGFLSEHCTVFLSSNCYRSETANPLELEKEKYYLFYKPIVDLVGSNTLGCRLDLFIETSSNDPQTVIVLAEPVNFRAPKSIVYQAYHTSWLPHFGVSLEDDDERALAEKVISGLDAIYQKMRRNVCCYVCMMSAVAALNVTSCQNMDSRSNMATCTAVHGGRVAERDGLFAPLPCGMKASV